MLTKPLLLVLAAVATAVQAWNPVYVQPEQLHLSLGAQPTEMVVTWTTQHAANGSVCHYGTDGFSQSATGTAHKFVDGGHKKRSMYIHRVYLKDLKPATKYYYHCGSIAGWSDAFYFHTFPAGDNWQPRFVIYGDLGNDNGQTMGMLQEEVQSGHHDLVMHVGDFAYDMHTDDALVGDEFMRQIQPIAAYLPYQTMAGNHERAYNYSNYNHRFTMHSQGDHHVNNHYWSYNIGPVHVIAFNTDLYVTQKFGRHMMDQQHRWLEADLKKANEPEQRARHPWIITMGHHPLYYQASIDEQLRIGNHTNPGLEHLFYKYGVDMEFWAHDHIYTRFLPVYDKKIHNGTGTNPYHNPKSPVHIITGSAGCREFVTPVSKHPHQWTSFVSNDYGYSYMTVFNHTHIKLEQVSKNQGHKVIDTMWLVKDKHGPQAWE